MPRPLPLDRPAPLFDVAATRRLEQAAAADLPPHTLMQRAGLAVAQLALAIRPHARTVWVACGPGNNGGDGFEAAMHLKRGGGHPIVTWLGSEATLPDDARASLQRARAAGVPFADEPPRDLGPQDLCIDALLGIGATRAPEGRMAQWLLRMDQGPAALLAVDVPTGLDTDTGAWQRAVDTISIANNADPDSAGDPFDPPSSAPERHTLTLLTVKPGLFTGQGRDACGTLWFDDLGVHSDDGVPPTAMLCGAPAASPRPHASHKGSFGDVAVIGGVSDAPLGASMAGAALLAASAALHAGAGRVYVGLLGDGGPTLDVAQPELMFRRPDELPLDAMTVVCGCGGGDAVRDALPAVLQAAPRLVLDADALNAIAQDTALHAALTARAARGQATVLTPHPLEAARLLATDTRHVQADRLRAAQTLATRFACVTVLKGSGSVIAAPDELPRINATGNARLATPGSGDVLAGLTGARMAGGMPPFDAACAAVYHHGQIADGWPADRALTASALARRLTA
jgi:hydroxyethylthiazole kinase-like uncharacterized protein yjeF